MKKFLLELITFFANLFKMPEVKIEEEETAEDGGDLNEITELVDDEAPLANEDEETEDTESENEEPENVAAAAPVQSKSNVRILIDNGHGTDTPGKRSPYSATGVEPAIPFFEYEWNREIAKAIVERLCAMGYKASLIVTESNDISLKERVARVNKVYDEAGAGNVIMISVHANAAGNGTKWMTGRGWSAYTTPGKTNSDKMADFLYSAAEKNFKGMKIRMDKSDGDADEEANFYIIKYTKCPSVLTENFFYDNVDDVKYILSDEGKEKVIQTHIDGIIAYINYLGR